MRPTIEQFLAGQTLAFKSLSGHNLLATFHVDEVSWMEFAYHSGKVIIKPLMSRDEAARFYAEAVADLQLVSA